MKCQAVFSLKNKNVNYNDISYRMLSATNLLALNNHPTSSLAISLFPDTLLMLFAAKIKDVPKASSHLVEFSSMCFRTGL